MRRDRLEARLADDERRAVTLVTGLPGAGKTTLIASWLRTQHRPAAWVSLDERHDAPGRLVRAVSRGLARIDAVPDPATRRRRADAASVDELVDTLAPGSWVLVLDDVHHLRSREALGALHLLLERVPPRLAVVMCSRADPPVALGRLRLEGRLGQIRNADLEFTLDETDELLARAGLDLRPDDVRALWARTQGWVAGLRLAAGALADAGDPHEVVVSATATEAAVADYLLEEVLDRQDPAAQEFLLRTSVAERVTPDLAALLTADPEAARRLDELERSGVFLTDSNEDGWYRYHALFADLLRATLRRRHPELVGEMHERAAAWLMANGHPTDAERHARLAGNWAMVGRLAIDRWLSATLDDAAAIPDPSVGVPSDALAATPALSLVAAGSACRHGDRDAADLHRGHVDTLLGPVPARATSSSGGLHRHLLDLGHAWAFGPDERAQVAATALAAADEIDTTTSTVRRLARLRAAEQAVDRGQFDLAVSALDELARGADDWIAVEATAVAALVSSAVGSPMDASRRATGVLARSDLLDDHPTARRAAHLATALACAQRGERRTAIGHLDEGEAAGAPASRLLDVTAAATRAGLAPTVATSAWLDSSTARHPLASQALIACGALEVIDPDRRVVGIGGAAERAVVRARQELARHAPDAARRAVVRVIDNDHPSVHARTIIEARIVAAIACDAGGESAAAADHLAAALDLVADSGIRAPLLDHGPAVGALLGRVELPGHGSLALEVRDQLGRGGGSTPVELLTDRETAVLQYLPTLMSNAEIAAGMHVSINTVKSHLKAVYRKLGVEGRRDAVLRGRELELI